MMEGKEGKEREQEGPIAHRFRSTQLSFQMFRESVAGLLRTSQRLEITNFWTECLDRALLCRIG
jgi:hypothetical protein